MRTTLAAASRARHAALVPPNASTSIHPDARRLRWAGRGALVLAAAMAFVLAHASWARSSRRAERHPEVLVLPSASLVLSTRSRWLRHPLLSEPAAAFQDGPAFFDADPAGALHAPPRALFSATEAAP